MRSAVACLDSSRHHPSYRRQQPQIIHRHKTFRRRQQPCLGPFQIEQHQTRVAGNTIVRLRHDQVQRRDPSPTGKAIHARRQVKTKCGRVHPIEYIEGIRGIAVGRIDVRSRQKVVQLIGPSGRIELSRPRQPHRFKPPRCQIEQQKTIRRAGVFEAIVFGLATHHRNPARQFNSIHRNVRHAAGKVPILRQCDDLGVSLSRKICKPVLALAGTHGHVVVARLRIHVNGRRRTKLRHTGRKLSSPRQRLLCSRGSHHRKPSLWQCPLRHNIALCGKHSHLRLGRLLQTVSNGQHKLIVQCRYLAQQLVDSVSQIDRRKTLQECLQVHAATRRTTATAGGNFRHLASSRMNAVTLPWGPRASWRCGNKIPAHSSVQSRNGNRQRRVNRLGWQRTKQLHLVAHECRLSRLHCSGKRSHKRRKHR